MVGYFKLDISKIPGDKIIVFIGKRGQGKTTVMKYLLMHMKKKLHSGIVFSPTERANGSWGEHVPELYIYEKYNPDVLQAFIKRQERICDENVIRFQKEKKRNPTTQERVTLRAQPAFVVLEDCFFDKNKLNKDEALRYLFMNGRHYNIFVLITLQYLLDLDTRMRGQIDYIFFSKENNPNVKKKIYHHYFGFYPSYAVFDKAFTRFTQNRGCAVLNTTEISNDINRNVYWIKAEYGTRFKLGCRGYRRHARRHYNYEYKLSQLNQNNNSTTTTSDGGGGEGDNEVKAPPPVTDWNNVDLKDETFEEMEHRKEERTLALYQRPPQLPRTRRNFNI